VFSRGVWAPAAHVDAAKAALAVERADPAHAKKLEASRARREKKQTAYVEDFRGAVLAFLAFHATHARIAGVIADAVTKHATPVGSGTVARTERFRSPSVEAAVTLDATSTTAYDDMVIPRVKVTQALRRRPRSA
jgi:hypothetical protein